MSVKRARRYRIGSNSGYTFQGSPGLDTLLAPNLGGDLIESGSFTLTSNTSYWTVAQAFPCKFQRIGNVVTIHIGSLAAAAVNVGIFNTHLPGLPINLLPISNQNAGYTRLLDGGAVDPQLLLCRVSTVDMFWAGQDDLVLPSAGLIDMEPFCITYLIAP